MRAGIQKSERVVNPDRGYLESNLRDMRKVLRSLRILSDEESLVEAVFAFVHTAWADTAPASEPTERSHDNARFNIPRGVKPVVMLVKGCNLMGGFRYVNGVMTGECPPGTVVIINGVDVCAAAASPEQKAQMSQALAALQKRFPGVIFSGNPTGVVIDSATTISPGARICLSTGMRLERATIGAFASLSGRCTIVDSVIDGEVSEGSSVTNRSHVAKGAGVSGGSVLRSTQLYRGASVSGGSTLTHVLLCDGAHVSSGATITRSTLHPHTQVMGGAELENMILKREAKVSGGAETSGFTVEPGQHIDSGVHIGKFDATAQPKRSGDVVSGNVIITGDIDGSHIRVGSNRVINATGTVTLKETQTAIIGGVSLRGNRR
jgi:hypothetical protein